MVLIWRTQFSILSLCITIYYFLVILSHLSMFQAQKSFFTKNQELEISNNTYI